jgi:hypothetical protein
MESGQKLIEDVGGVVCLICSPQLKFKTEALKFKNELRSEGKIFTF